MKGIRFMTDFDGSIIAVQIDLNVHRQLWEDFKEFLSTKISKEDINSLSEAEATHNLIVQKMQDITERNRIKQIIKELEEEA